MDEIKSVVDTGTGQPVDHNRILEFNKALNKYKAGKAHLERRIISSEQWWKMRNESEEKIDGVNSGTGFKCKSGWLHNVLVSKHADAMGAYPEPLILPREPGDKQEAKTLSSVLPVILEENDFEQVYSDAWWDKLKHGVAVYMIVWDSDKLNGIGDVSIRRVDPLNLFWEPGIRDIQKSKYFFHCELRNNDDLTAEYPQLVGKLGTSMFTLSKYVYDDTVPTDDKSLVIDCYYKKNIEGKQVVHFVKYVNDEILISTENDQASASYAPVNVPAQNAPEQPVSDVSNQGDNLPVDSANADSTTPVASQVTTQQAEPSYSMAVEPEYAPQPEPEQGIYDDGMYPFVFDILFPIEGSPCGYGYVDLCKNTQEQIDLMDGSMLKNLIAGATPRYFKRIDGGVNAEQFLDLTRPLVDVDGNLGDDSIKIIDYKPLSDNYVTMYSNKITELRETSGNTESANGISSAGVTSGSAIAALQEASGKTSRDANKASYRAFAKITKMVIERIRQFYDLPRYFRITGQFGQEEYVVYDNSGLKPQWQGGIGNTDLGFKLPEFDIKVAVAKKSDYSRVTQNDLALQFFNLGFFNPQYATQALNCLDMMDFDGREELMQKLQQNGTLYSQMQQLSQYTVGLLNKYEPANAQAMAQSLGLSLGSTAGGTGEVKSTGNTASGTKENPISTRSREQSQSAATPNGG